MYARMYTAGMAKQPATYRIDPVLLRAVTDRAARQHETVTDVVVRAFRAYVEDGSGQDDTLHRKRANPRAAGAASPRGAQPPGRCTHPGTRIIGGYCAQCDHIIEPGGTWR